MSLSLGAKTAIGISVLIAALVATGIMTVALRENQTESRQLLVHTYEVLNQLEQVLSTIKDAETGQRGFILTGDEKYLDPYHSADAKLDAAVAKLGELTGDSPAQQHRLGKLSVRTDERLKLLQESIDLRRKQGFEEAQKLVRTGRGRKAMEDIRRIIQEMQDMENQLLLARAKKVEESNRAFTYVSLLFIATAIGAVLVTVTLVHRFLKARREAEKELERSEHALSDFFDNAVVGLCWVDGDGVFLKANKMLLETFGYGQDELIGKHCRDYYPDKDVLQSILASIESRQELKDVAARVKCKDGSIKHVILSSSAYRVDDKFIHMRFSSRDVTLQRKAEMELEEREARYRAILATAPDCIVTFDSNGMIETANVATTKLFGWQAEELIGKPIGLIVPKFLGDDEPMAPDLLSTGENKIFGVGKEFEGIRKNGMPVQVELAWSVLNLGEKTIFTAVIRDVSERKAVQQRIAESERKFRAIFDQTFQLIGLLAPDGTLLEANRTALDLAGAERKDVIGLPFWECPWWAHSKELQEQLKQSVEEAASGKFVRFETSHPDSNGEMISIDFSLKPVLDEQGKVVMLIPEGRDISESKEAERRVRDFYSTVSHELRTPLTSIRGSLGLIEGGLAGEVPPKAARLINIARSESDRLIRLINDILDLRKIEAGKLELKKATVDVQTLVEKSMDGMRGMAADAGIALKSETLTNGPTECDEDRILQVLSNLISNAIKFSPPGSEVLLSVEPGVGHSFRFNIVDKGPGIPADQMHKLFGKFQQLDQGDTRKIQKGTGLGLAITKSIVELHGGSIGVESKVGDGTTFWFELPASFKPKHVKTPSEPQAIHPALIVEDDDRIAEILEEHLLQDGFKVARVATLQEAREKLSQITPLVIILDLKLPDGDGLDLLKSLSEDSARSKIPVVIVTASTQGDTSTFGHPAVIDWITKPFSEDQLHYALSCAREKIGPARVLIVEDDPSTRAVLSEQLSALGIRCLEAADGAEALTRFRGENPDLIILDLVIPPPNGYDVVDILRNEKNGVKPLIVYTASDLSEEQKRKLQLGLTAHLTKGTTTQDHLLNTVRQFLNGLLEQEPKENSTET